MDIGNTFPSQEKVSLRTQKILKEFDRLFQEDIYLLPHLKYLLSKELKIKTDPFRPPPKFLSRLSNTNLIQDFKVYSKSSALDDDNIAHEATVMAYDEIRHMKPEHISFISKYIGYVEVDEVRKMANILDYLPITNAEIEDYNERNSDKKTLNPKKYAYYFCIATNGRALIRELKGKDKKNSMMKA